jgi:adhesin/invasin
VNTRIGVALALSDGDMRYLAMAAVLVGCGDTPGTTVDAGVDAVIPIDMAEPPTCALVHATSVTTSAQPTSVVVARVDADAHVDILVLTNTQVLLYRGDGDGHLDDGTLVTTTQAGGTGSWAAHRLAAADFDGDAKLDVAYIDGAGVAMRRGNGDGTFASATPVTLSTVEGAMEVQRITATDIDGDQNQDLVILRIRTSSGPRIDSAIDVLRGDGQGMFGTPVVLRLPLGPAPTDPFMGDPLPFWFVTGDVTGDGHADLIVSTPSNMPMPITLYRGNGTGAFASPQGIADRDGAHPLTLADVDLDGDRDLVVAGSSIRVLRGDDTGQFGSPIEVFAADPMETLATDLTGDGVIDIVAANFSSSTLGNVSLLVGTGTATFEDAANTTACPDTSCLTLGIASGDFDEDGRADVVVANYGADTVDLLATRCQ